MSARYSDTDSFTYNDPPECINACLDCPLPDCQPTRLDCPLLALGRVKKIKSPRKPAAGSKTGAASRLHISEAIKTKGTTVQEWCRENNIKYDQLARYEHAPPIAMTSLRIRIEKALQNTGIVIMQEDKK